MARSGEVEELSEVFLGVSGIVANQIDDYVRQKNPNAPLLGRYYVEVGKKFRIRACLAAGQMVHETGWLLFGGQVKPGQHNPAGLKMNRVFITFPDWYAGVHAHYERLAQYLYPVCPNPDCGKYDPAHSPKHWQYQKLKEVCGKTFGTVECVARLWCPTSRPAVYAAIVEKHAAGIRAMPAKEEPVPPPVPVFPLGPLVVVGGGTAAAFYLLRKRRA